MTSYHLRHRLHVLHLGTHDIRTPLLQQGPDHVDLFAAQDFSQVFSILPRSRRAFGRQARSRAKRNGDGGGLVIFPMVVLLTISTFYCKYHYIVDAIAGVFAGIVMYYLTMWIWRKNTGQYSLMDAAKKASQN